MNQRSYEVRTYGCQMNVHDSERLSGLLEDAGYVARRDGDAGRRRGLQHLRGAGERRQPALRQPRPPGAGEEGQPRHADRGRRLPRAEGPRRDHPPRALGRRGVRHPQHRVAAGAARAGPAQRGGPGRDRRVARDVPLDAADPARVAYAAWVSISVGCNNTCTFCIVPALHDRGQPAPCNDGNACTTSDTCGGGSCQGGAPPNCNDGNLCTDDTCYPASGCANTNNTAPCSDGNSCTAPDVCGGGSCQSGAAFYCSSGSTRRSTICRS